MKSNNYTVYCHIFPNGKRYFGVTSQKVKERWGNNGKGYKNSEYLYNAIKKYGWKNIEHVIISKNLSMKEASELEIMLINQYRTCEKQFGYNIAKGGVQNFGIVADSTKQKLRRANLGKVMTEESKRKISESLKGRKKSLQVREKMKKAQKLAFQNGNNAMHSEKAREKARKSLQGKVFSEVVLKKATEAKYHAVVNLITNETYQSIKEATEKTGLNRSTIIRHCQGKTKKQKWQYL